MTTRPTIYRQLSTSPTTLFRRTRRTLTNLNLQRGTNGATRSFQSTLNPCRHRHRQRRRQYHRLCRSNRSQSSRRNLRGRACKRRCAWWLCGPCSAGRSRCRLTEAMLSRYEKPMLSSVVVDVAVWKEEQVCTGKGFFLFFGVGDNTFTSLSLMLSKDLWF